MEYMIEINGREVERHTMLTAAYDRADEFRRTHGIHAVQVRDIPDASERYDGGHLV